MSKRRQRTPHPLAKARVIREIFDEIRAKFPLLPIKQETAIINFLRAALYAASHEANYSGLGRPPRWKRGTLQEAATFCQALLNDRTQNRLSFASFVKHYCPILRFPADVLVALEKNQITLFEAEQLARVVPGREGRSEVEARQKRAELLAFHLRTKGASNALRQQIIAPKKLTETKTALKTLIPAKEDSTAEMQREIDAFAEQVEQLDYTFLFVDGLSYLVQNILQIDLSKLPDSQVDRLLVKLDEFVEIVRDAIEKSSR